MKRFITIVIITLLTLSVWAVPARHIFKTYTQPDGTKVKMALVGDEHFHYLATQEGVAMQVDSNSGFYVPMEAEQLEKGLKLASDRRQHANLRRTTRLAANRAMYAPAAPAKEIGVRSSIVGKKKGLVILVNFVDQYIASPLQKFEEMFNKVGYNDNDHIGSVRDYFYDQSYGKLEIDFDVVGPVSMPEPSTFYGKDASATLTDVNAGLMVIEACKAADEWVDFSDYDWDGDGVVDQVFLVYAGYGAHHEGANPNWLWPAEWTLESSEYYFPTGQYPLVLDGVMINTYAYASELAYSSGTTTDGIGTACHEFAHCLGLPDVYDREYNCCPSMFQWDLMDSGSYNGPYDLGEVPSGLTAYERWTAGWLELTELQEPCAIKDMPDLGEKPFAYILYNEGSRNEAFILENRQNNRWFSYPLNAHGMLIYHVDYNESVWLRNELNVQKSHPRMAVVPASDDYGDLYAAQGVYAPSTYQLRGHLWPGTTNNSSFTDSSKPASTLFNANKDGSKNLGIPIEKIKETGGKISFLVNGGDVYEAPMLSYKQGAAPGTIVLSWNPISDASAYDLRMTAVSTSAGAPEVILEEPLSGSMYSASYGNTNIANSLDAYMNNYGWTGVNVFKGPLGAKLGSSNGMGILQSPLLETEGVLSVSALFTPFSTDDPNGKIVLLNESGQEINAVNYTATGVTQVFELSGATNPCCVRILPNRRVSVKNLKIEVRDSDARQDRLVKDISETHYEVAVVEGYNYSFQIRAVSETGSSPWSALLTLEDGSAIEQLYVAADAVSAYDLNGRITSAHKGLMVRQGRVMLMK